MSLGDATYDLQELCDEAKVTSRTVRYYIQQGLLPAPDAQGPATRYTQGHLDRLRLIRQLQAEHQPLAVIRKRLGELTDEDVHRLLKSRVAMATRAAAKSPSSAVDYVRSVLNAKSAAVLRSEPDPAFAAEAVSPYSPPVGKSQWERISLTPDVELHVRRPLTREDNRRVEKLLDLARQILQEGK